jgi:hypothetical protein
VSADLQSIASFSDSFEANLAVNRLRDEGIEASLGGDITNNTLGLGLTSAIQLLVPKEEMERAEAVLEEFAKEIDARQHRPKEAIMAEPPPTAPEEIVEPLSFDEQLIQYAYRASLLGFFLCTPFYPVAHLYALLLLVYLSFRGKDLRPEYSRKYYLSMLISAVTITGGAIVLVFVYGLALFTFFAAWACVSISVVMFLITVLSPRAKT